MATNILMPALSPTMTEGTLARWLKKEGEKVAAGDVIAEIETDKATMEVEAADEGVLGKILVPDGTQNVKVNEPIAVLVEEGESVPAEAGAGAAQAPRQDAGEVAAALPQPEAPRQLAGADPAAAKPVAPQAPRQPEPGRAEPRPEPPPAARGGNGQAVPERVFASPLARRMAHQAGIDLAGLRGSGPNGRILRADIEAAAKGAGARPSRVPEPSAAGVLEARGPAPSIPPAPALRAGAITAPHDLIPISNMRKVIARRLTESKQQVPHFYLSMNMEIDALLKLRADLNAKSAGEGPGAFKLSVNDLVIKAAAIALRRVPKANASYTEDGIAQYKDVDISVAVAIPDGLITPIIRKADQKGLAAISNEMKDLIARAKAGKLKLEEFQGGGFSISNLGMYGISEFAAVINPPQGAILAVGAGEQRPVVRQGALAIATMMTCTLSVDHRVIDGALGAEWLAAFKSIIEDPLSLML